MAEQQAQKVEKNKIGLTRLDYAGGKSTLCLGCGHITITNQIITAAFENSLDPSSIVKFSGIGCSSKTPAYFISKAQGFNTVHGRMPSVASGALVANRSLKGIGVSGDGDSSNIGLGQFCHMIRRNVPLVYIIENNGCYGLTKGQFSATAEVGDQIKGGPENRYHPIDLCALAINMGCTYVARSFAGDQKQVLALLKGALSHKGTAVLDIISPCVTFNNHESARKGYKWAQEHEEILHHMDYIPPKAEIKVEMEEGDIHTVTLHDGSKIVLRKADKHYDPTDRVGALKMLGKTAGTNEFMTGLVYVEKQKPDLFDTLELPETPLSQLDIKELRPTAAQWKEIMSQF